MDRLIYVNYGHGDEDNGVLYSENELPKLRQLKSVWDPDNVCRINHDITANQGCHQSSESVILFVSHVGRAVVVDLHRTSLLECLFVLTI